MPTSLTGRERIQRILRRQPVDRIGLYEHFWGDTQKAWADAGKIRMDENLSDHFGFDIEECWAFNFTADLDWVDEVVEETEETRLVRDGNGALLRRHKFHDTTPEHVDFRVKTREDWDRWVKPVLKAEKRRINIEGYRAAREHARLNNHFFVWSGVNVFELMHPVAGHLNMLLGMAADPDWVKDMVDTFSRITLELQEILFAEAGEPDGIWYYEDMGLKGRPFMSPEMYREIIQPAHTRTFAWAHQRKLPVIVHSCGYVDPLVPGLIEAGMDCLQVIEVKAGMDLPSLHKRYGDRIALMGGIDVRAVYTNDRAVIDRELESKIPLVKQGFGFVLHSDHSIPNTVAYDTYRYFISKGLELGSYR